MGIGASRVRDLFVQAKEAAPAIIFIDELDAIGRSRGGGSGSLGGHDEREQTLNQILTEMDGFDPAAGVIVLGATNRPDVLDPALLRPGRFDRRVAVQPPDSVGRELILKVHTRSVPLADDVDLAQLASTTPGMVGADLANLVNEAALLAARRGHDKVARADFTDALEKIVLGAERKIVLGEEDRRRIAYHEGGHAIVGMLTPGADPVRKVSIIPRGMALGVTLSTPDDDRFNLSEEELRSKIRVALGGRVAEEVVFGDITTGAESDIQHVTRIARGMVARWGMSEKVGFITVAAQEGQSLLLPGAEPVSQATQELVDAEVRRIVDEEHEATLRLVSDNRERLDALAEALLERETLDELDAYAAAGIDRTAQRRHAARAGLPPLLRLRLEQRHVGGREHVLGGRVARHLGRAQGERDPAAVACLAGLGHPLGHPAQHRVRGVAVGGGHHHHELVAAPAKAAVAAAHGALHRARHLAQGAVALEVAEAVVHAPEVVHVHQPDAERGALARGPGDLDRERLVERAPVAQAGQLVHAREPARHLGARSQAHALAAHVGLVGGEQHADGHEDQCLGGHVGRHLAAGPLVQQRQRQRRERGAEVGQRAPRRVRGAGAEPEHEEVLVGRGAAAGEVVQSRDRHDAGVGDHQQIVEARLPPQHRHGAREPGQPERGGDRPAGGAQLVVDGLEGQHGQGQQAAEEEQPGHEAPRGGEVRPRVGVVAPLEQRAQIARDRLPWRGH